MVKSTLARVCLASAIAIGLVTSLSANHSWGGYHWARTSNEFTVSVGENVSVGWESYLGTAISDWSRSTVLDAVQVSGSSGNPRTCKPRAGRVEVCNASYGNNGWLGIAQIWITGGVHITQGVVKMNDTYFNSATYNNVAWKNLVMCQEVGHTFGLAHQDENFNNPNLDTCMDYTSNPWSNQHPDDHDYAMLESIYAHEDTFNSYSTSSSARLPVPMPPAMGLIDLDNPRNWGESIHKNANGRQETFELDFGGGNKVVTEVFWADLEHDAH
jgi:hypothetical protein